MDRDLDDWLATLVSHPGDAAVRMIFADWLAEQGDYAGEAGERWAAREGKWPRKQTGWYESEVGGRQHQLPKSIMTHKVYDAWFPLEAERAFLLRCRELEWDESGPVDVTRTVAS